MIYLSKCNLLYQSIFITLRDIQNYPFVDTTGYLNPQLLNVNGAICMHMHKHTKSSKYYRNNYNLYHTQNY